MYQYDPGHWTTFGIWLNWSYNRQFYPQIISYLKKEKKKSFPQSS